MTSGSIFLALLARWKHYHLRNEACELLGRYCFTVLYKRRINQNFTTLLQQNVLFLPSWKNRRQMLPAKADNRRPGASRSIRCCYSETRLHHRCSPVAGTRNWQHLYLPCGGVHAWTPPRGRYRCNCLQELHVDIDCNRLQELHAWRQLQPVFEW